jgi:glycine betaine/proline transport system permease protein
VTIELVEIEHPTTPLEHPEGKRGISRWWLLLAVLVTWVLGWLVLQGNNTLELPTAELTGFQEWLNDLRNAVLEAKFDDNPLLLPFEWVSSAFNWLYDFLVDIFLEPSFGRSVPVIGWLGLVAMSAWVALALAGVRIALLVAAVLVGCGLLGY